MDGPQTNPNANHPGNAPRETPVSPSPPTDLPTVTLGGEEYRRWVRQEIATSLFVRASAIATGVGAVGIGIIYTLLTAQVGTKMQEYDRKIAAIDNTIDAKWNAALPTIKTDLGNEAEVYITRAFLKQEKLITAIIESLEKDIKTDKGQTNKLVSPLQESLTKNEVFQKLIYNRSLEIINKETNQGCADLH